MTAKQLLLSTVLFFAGSGLWIKQLYAAEINGAEEINVAVASNFKPVMNDLVAHFQQQSGHRVKLSFGSSGKIFAQIKYGAPFYIFFSADQAKPIALEQEGLIEPNSRFTYAIGTLALWSTKKNFVTEELLRLKSGDFNKLAMANPKLAPYGAAAVEVLDHLSLTASTQPKWVQGENIAQTYQFVSTGNADLGFVALSQIIDKGHSNSGSIWIVPEAFHQPIRQDVVLLKRGKNSRAAAELLQFMRSGEAKKIIEAYGYKTLTSTSKTIPITTPITTPITIPITMKNPEV